MYREKVCKNKDCKSYGRRYPKGYIFCPFCAKKLIGVSGVDNKTIKIYQTPKKESINLSNIPRFDSKNPDATDRLVE